MLHVEGERTLRTAAAYYGRMDKEVKAALRAKARSWSPLLVKEAIVRASSYGAPAVALAESGKVTSTNKGLQAKFGATGFFPASGGRRVKTTRLVPFEFGANQDKYEQYLSRQRTSKRAMQVNRRAQRQMPKRRKRGYFIFPAVADTTPVLVGLWVSAIADVAERATDGR
jgi:hypothetical protein